MKNCINKIAVFFVVGGMLGALHTHTALAGTACSLTKADFDNLESIQKDYSLEYSTEIKLELATRKELLRKVLACATEDATSLNANINKTKLDDPEAASLQSQLSNQLDNAINYYKTQGTKVDDLGIQGSKDFAVNLSQWREGNYKTIAQRANNFAIWSENRQIFKTAQTRANQISQSVTLLRLVYDGNVQNQWVEADAQFTDAKKMDQKARGSMMSETPDVALISIKASLDSLAKTYEKMALVINTINKELALPE